MIGELVSGLVEPAIGGAMRDARKAARVALLRATIALVAAIGFATGVVFCAWAAYAALAEALSPPIAGLIVGTILILTATIAIWWVLARTSPDDDPVQEAQAAQAAQARQADAMAAAGEAVQLAEGLLRRNSGSILIGALVAGVAAGTLTGKGR